MKSKKTILLVLMVSSLSWAQSFFDASESSSKQESFFTDKPIEASNDAVLTFEAEKKKFNVRESHWGLNLNMSAAQFRPNYTYTSTKADKSGKSFDSDKTLVFGPTIEFGRDYHLTPRIVAATKLQAFYYQGSSQDNTLADETIKVSISNLKTDIQGYGVGVSQMLGHDFKYSTYIIRPFMSYAVGLGSSNSKLDYQYELGTGDTESFNMTVEDSHVYNTLSAGIEVISSSGIAFNLIGSRSGYLSGTAQRNGVEFSSSTSPVKNEIVNQEVESTTGEPAYSLSLGLGYYF